MVSGNDSLYTYKLLVECYLLLRDSTASYVGPLVGQLVGQSVGCSPFGAAAPKGSMTYAFTHMGNFFLLLLCPPPSNPSLEA